MLLASLLVVVAAVVVAVRASTSGASAKPTPGASPAGTGGVLRFLSENRFASLDPAALVTPREQDVGRLLYRTLMTYDTDGRSLVPDLAAAAGRPSQGGRVWTYELRQGQRYETGTAVTASDVVRGIRRTRARGSEPLRALLDVRVASASSVVLRFAKPFPDADALVALTGTTPVPDIGPLASGPYQLADLVPGVRFQLVRNQSWISSKVMRADFDEVVAELGLEGATIDRRLLASAGSDAFAVTDKQVLDMTGPVPDKRVVRGPDGSVQFSAMNLRRGPFVDIKVRQALEVAFPLAATLSAAGGAAVAMPATDLVPPSVEGHQDLDAYGQRDRDFAGDPVRARQLLKDAGYPEGVTVMTFIPRTDAAAAVAAALAARLAPAGFLLKVTTVPAATYYESVGVVAKQPDLVSYAWSPDWPSAAAVIAPLFTCAALTPVGNHNVANHCDRGFDAQVSAAMVELDSDNRERRWEALDRRLVEEAIVVPRSFGVSTSLVGTRVRHARSALAFGGAVDLANLTSG